MCGNRFPDVIVALDGNFQHRRYRHVNEDPILLEKGDSFGWVTANEIDEARKHVEECKNRDIRSPITRLSASIPVKVLDDCETSYKAAQEKMKNLDESAYSSKGIMAMVCTHDIPLFIADIETLGEPRYLAISLIRKLNSLLPPQSTIGIMYDIADQLDRTIEKVLHSITRSHNLTNFLILSV